MNPIILRAAVALALFGAGWLVNGWRLGERIAGMQTAQAEAALQAEAAARAKEQDFGRKLKEAQDAANQREAQLRAAADNARRSSVGLRDELADLRRQLPSLADDAVRLRADTLAAILDECQSDYRGMAEKADRHASDVQKLMDSWPK